MSRVGGRVIEGWGFNPPPCWPQPPDSWTPPAGWSPDPAWGPVPPGWQLWVPARRPRRGRAVLPVTGLAAIVVIAVLSAAVPRTDGLGTDDPRAAGVALVRRHLPPVDPGTLGTPEARPGTHSAATPTPATAVIRQFRTCSALNRAYPNGVGMPDAIDRTAGDPVTNFGRSTTIYRMNLKHDRDGDGIACEPR